MNLYEIERKFTVNKEKIPKEWDSEHKIKQAYLMDTNKGVTRIRQKDDKYILTIKMRDSGIKQVEIEKYLTKEEFELLWIKTDKKIVKTRKIKGPWEVDFFENLTGEYKDLIIAEIELNNEDELFKKEDWLDVEVTESEQYFNSNLIKYSI